VADDYRPYLSEPTAEELRATLAYVRSLLPAGADPKHTRALDAIEAQLANLMVCEQPRFRGVP
jgi:hypothetical protein